MVRGWLRDHRVRVLTIVVGGLALLALAGANGEALFAWATLGGVYLLVWQFLEGSKAD